MTWKGPADSGGREYEDWQYKRVVEELKAHHVGFENRVTIEALAANLNIKGRTIRAIISHADGREFVVGEEDSRETFIATCDEDADRKTRMLFATGHAITQRAQRRRDYPLPKMQQSLL